eukprot:c32693_g1_i1 orf=48-206(+)
MRLRRKIVNEPLLIGQEPNKRRRLVPPQFRVSGAKSARPHHEQDVLLRGKMP